MGSENLHHRIKQRTRDSFKRQISRRDPYDFVLIVCEGTKTEPYYLKALCDDLKLNNANIKVVGLGADPLQIVERALKEYNETKDYDRIFCVFDKDQHPNYQDALIKIKAIRQRPNKSIPIYSIVSVPCFEYWLLLHFIDSARPYNTASNKSPGDLLLNEIKSHIKDYQKGCKDIFYKTKPYLQVAIARARKISMQQEINGTDNPSTNMYELVEYLSSIKNNK
jgi:hypothetical protein